MKVKAISPAKVNLFLAVGKPDVTNYHPIRTVFQAVSLADELTIQDSETGKDEIVCNWPDLPPDNTLTKALRLIREMIPVPPLQIELTKNIPDKSGLGGGSSNAAALLRAVNLGMASTIDDYILQDVAAAVGADVPFFLVGGLAQATGYGEKLTPLPDHDPLHLLIVRPNEGVSTAKAYSDIDQLDYDWKTFPVDPLDPRSLYNDFERVAPCICGELAERLQIHGAQNALLTGSGSAVFGLFPDEKTAINAKNQLKQEGFDQSWVTTTLNRKESLWTTL